MGFVAGFVSGVAVTITLTILAMIAIIVRVEQDKIDSGYVSGKEAS